MNSSTLSSRRGGRGRASWALLWLLAFAPSLAAQRPNIVLILADDLGYGDIGAYGNTANRTPHLDRLAHEGLRFTDFHANGPMCSPTRAALLTGRYQQRFGPEFEAALSARTHYDRGLPLRAVTLAEVLRGAGYATAIYGKWHLGYKPPFLPTGQGFDEFRGLVSGGGDHHSHIDRSGRRDWWHNERIEMEQGYAAELLTGHAVDFIRRNKDQPFFLYVPHLSIHFPWQGPEDEGYRVEGGDYWNLTKLGRLESKNVASQTKKMIEALDQSVGRIAAALEQHGLAENTIFVFTSDNGGYRTYDGGFHEISSNGTLRGQKTEVYEGGHRVPAIVRWPGQIEPGVSDETVMSFDLFPTLARLAGANIDALALDGVDLEPLLRRRLRLGRRSLFWRIGTSKAARQGRWKLVVPKAGEPELYDLRRDIAESRDVARDRPRQLARLARALQRWESEVESELELRR